MSGVHAQATGVDSGGSAGGPALQHVRMPLRNFSRSSGVICSQRSRIAAKGRRGRADLESLQKGAGTGS